MLVGADEVAAAILLVARFGGFIAEGLFFAVADGAEAVGGDAQGDEILFHGGGATISQAEVVFGGAALIAVAFDGGFNVWIGAKEFGGGAESFASVGANVGFIQIEVRVFDFLAEDLVSDCDPYRWARRSRQLAMVMRTLASAVAAGTGCGDGVGRGVSGRDFSGAFGRNWADFRRDSDLRGVGGGPGESGSVALVNAGGIGLESDRGARRAASVRAGAVLRVVSGFLPQPKLNTAADRAASRQVLYNFGETANIRISSSHRIPRRLGKNRTTCSKIERLLLLRVIPDVPALQQFYKIDT